MAYDIDPSAGEVRIVGGNRLTMPEMIAVVDAVAEDARYRPQYHVVLDIREASYTAELSDGDAFVGALRRRRDQFQGRFALVVPDSLHTLARLFCLLAESNGFERMKCFTDLGAARQWCGLS